MLTLFLFVSDVFILIVNVDVSVILTVDLKLLFVNVNGDD